MKFSHKQAVTVNDCFAVLKKNPNFNVFKKDISLKDRFVFTCVTTISSISRSV